MSGEKAREKQPRDTAEDALLKLQALRNTHREATRLFLMAVRQAATDDKIDDTLMQGLPHLTDPASLQGTSVGKQAEGSGTTEESQRITAQKKSLQGQ